MFWVKREYKFALFLFSSICLSGVILNYIPFGGIKYILSICFIISELPYIVSLKWINKNKLLLAIILLILVSFIVLLFNSPHYNSSISQLIRLSIFELVGKYFAFLYAFIVISKNSNLKIIFRIVYVGIIILTLFGFFNYITKHASFIEILDISGYDQGGKFELSERFRVQSMFFNPFDYGYICIIMLYFLIWGEINNYLSKKQLFVSVICCLFGVITCGCRTNVFCLFIGLVAYVIMKYNLKSQLVFALVACLIIVSTYIFVPYIHNVGDYVLSMFSSDAYVEGSSIEMRLLQYTTVFYYVQGHWLTGNGYNYFNIDMGWADGGRENLIDEDLYGLEGVLMNHLLERGIIGIIFYLLFYIILFVFFIKNKYVDFTTSCLGVSVLLVYFSFANMTGDLLSVFPTLLILGFCTKIIIFKKQESVVSNRN